MSTVNMMEIVAGEIRQIDNSGLTNIAERVLEYMASLGNCTGSITVGTSNPIGTFVDTVRAGGVGSSNVTILSSTYTLSQVATTTITTSNPPYYVGLDTTNPNEIVIKENLTTANAFADFILNKAITSGPFCYYLGTSAPSDGGVWTNMGNLVDTLENFTVNNTIYGLWKKISSGTSDLGKRPLKIQSNELTQLSLDEIKSYAKIVEQRIVSTGISTYKIQNTVPATGVWENAGTIYDARRTTSPVAYVGPDTFYNPGTTYLGPGAESYTGTTPSNFVGTTPSNFVGTIPSNFVGTTPSNFVGTTPSNFVGTIPSNFVGTTPSNFYGTVPSNFVGTTPSNFVGLVPANYDGVTPANYDGLTPANYDGLTPVAYLGVTPANYDGLTPANYDGVTPANYDGLVPANYDGTVPVNYDGLVPANYDGLVPANYDGTNPNLVTYSSDNSYTSDQNFYGIAVSSSLESVSSVTLWKRIG